MTQKQSDETYKALCSNGLTHEVAQFLTSLAEDISDLKEKISNLTKFIPTDPNDTSTR